MPTPHNLTRVTLAAIATAPALALAQPVSMPVQVPDVVSFEVQGAVEQHSNIFRTPTGTSDTVLRGLLGLRFEREVSLQRFSVFANARPTKYLDNSRYDFVGWGAGATWNWEIGRPVFGTLSAGYTRDQSPFDVVGVPVSNLFTVVDVRALVGLRMTQSWSAIAATDYLTLDNSLALRKASDLDRTGLEAGVRYAPQTATSLDFVYRREAGEYPNRQVLDANGNLLPTTIDNAYSQDAFLVRVGWRPSDLTRLTGNVGYTRRSFDNLPQRDFSGVTGSLDWERPLSGAVLMRASVFRRLDVTELLNANYIIATGAGLLPTWKATDKLALDGILVYTNRRYAGDPGFAITGADVRVDKVLDFGLRLNYEFARRVFFYGDLRRLERTSNYPGNDFTDNWFGVGVRALF